MQERAVLPAYAGVFRRPPRNSPPDSGPPRRRGGVPITVQFTVTARPSFPPMRGCSVRFGEPMRHLGVLPATWGVFSAVGCTWGRPMGRNSLGEPAFDSSEAAGGRSSGRPSIASRSSP